MAAKKATKSKAAPKKAAPKAKPAKKAPVKAVKKAPAKAAKKAPAKAAAKKAPAKKAAPAKAPAAKKVAAPAPAPKKNLPVPPKKPALVTPKNNSSKQYTASEFYEVVKEYCGFVSRRHARDFYEQFAELIQTALKSGFKVVLPGLGKIQVRKTKARMGRNPATQEPMMIPAKRKVAFTALKSLKESVL